MLVQINGSFDKRKYISAAQELQPRKVKDLVEPLATKIPSIKLKNGMDFKRYWGQLTNACYIICGGFSGMRDSEIDKLTPKSYYKDNFEGRDFHMLQSHTFKLGHKRETWVTASSSKTAIELMTTLTEEWRKEVSYPDKKYKDSIWVNKSYRSKPPTLITGWNHRLQRFCKQFNFIVTEEDFAECLESNPHSFNRVKKDVTVGNPWHITTHQFRRTLAFYCIKNRLGTLVALKQQFKHLYLAMTEWYTNGGRLASLRDLKVDEQVQKALDEINAETTTNKIFKQWHSDEKLSGTYGKAIMKMRGDVPTIYSSWDVIYKAVKDGKLTLHGSMHSYCKSGYDCDMNGVVAPQFCVDCGSGSSIIDEQQAKWWQKKHRSLVAYMKSDEDISVSEQSHYITQVRAAEKVMADFDMPFTPFEPDLKVANL
nr:Phage Integrase [Vibrio cholerae]